jgi:DNA-binding NarL/FixJ family response regulator
MVRILIADGHEVVRTGLQDVWAAQSDWCVVAVAADGKEAIHKAAETNPDVAVIDYALPLIDGIEVTRQIRSRLSKTEVLIFSLHSSEWLTRELLRAGARGHLLKSDANQSLIAAIKIVASHESFFTPTAPERWLHAVGAEPDHGSSALTERERQVIQLIAEGHTAKRIAQLLNISFRTVQVHRLAALRKLNLSKSTHLVRYAIRNDLVEA